MRVGAAESLMGVNPRDLATEGLVDTFLIAHRAPRPHEPDLEGLQAALQNTGAEVYACVARTDVWGKRRGPLHPELVDRLNRSFLAAGAAGTCFYETRNLLYFPELRRSISRFSRPTDLPTRAF
jgi:hypothetical protein